MHHLPSPEPREHAAYFRSKPDLLDRFRDQYVVFVGEEMIGPFDTFLDASRAGSRAFGPGPLYIKQVTDEEPSTYLFASSDRSPS